MKLTVFQSDQGDCLMLTARDGTRVLIDGGMRSSYTEHVAPTLGKLAKAGEKLDLVYVSHIDRDHISGVLQMLDDEVAWRVHDHQLATGNAKHREPASPRPPEIDELWNNTFHELVGANAGPIEDMLAATSAALETASARRDLELAAGMRGLVASIPEGIQLARRAGPSQLGIPVNRAFGGRLAMVRADPKEIELGALKVSVLAPFKADLDKLRREWNDWLTDNQAELEKIRGRMRDDADRLGTNEVELLRGAIELRGKELGDRTQVTPPNLASLMLLVKEDKNSLLLTGDGHADDILAGLDHVGALNADGCLHVDVLKVQHHGSEHNIDPAFCRRVTADHYVFCGNGAHENPEPAAIEAIVDARLGPAGRRSPNPAADGGFKCWFNSSSAATERNEHKDHMKLVEALIEDLAGGSGGRMSLKFLDEHFFELPLEAS